jgi:hypothetical protein
MAKYWPKCVDSRRKFGKKWLLRKGPVGLLEFGEADADKGYRLICHGLKMGDERKALRNEWLVFAVNDDFKDKRNKHLELSEVAVRSEICQTV